MPISIAMARALSAFSAISFVPAFARCHGVQVGGSSLARRTRASAPHDPTHKPRTRPERVRDPSPHELLAPLHLQLPQQLLDAVFFFEAAKRSSMSSAAISDLAWLRA